MSSSEANARTRGKALVFEVVQGPELVVQIGDIKEVD